MLVPSKYRLFQAHFLGRNAKLLGLVSSYSLRCLKYFQILCSILEATILVSRVTDSTAGRGLFCSVHGGVIIVVWVGEKKLIN